MAAKVLPARPHEAPDFDHRSYWGSPPRKPLTARPGSGTERSTSAHDVHGSLKGEISHWLEWTKSGTSVAHLKNHAKDHFGMRSFEVNCRPDLSLDGKIRGWEVTIHWHGVTADGSMIADVVKTKLPRQHTERALRETN